MFVIGELTALSATRTSSGMSAGRVFFLCFPCLPDVCIFICQLFTTLGMTTSRVG